MAIENIQTAAGASFSLSAALPATLDAAGFGAVTGFDVVGEITDMGEVGGSYGEVTHTPVDTRLVQRLKTTFDAGTQTIQLAISSSDAGQAIAQAALHSDDQVTVKILLQDGTAIYYTGLVMSFPYSIGSGDSIVNSSINISINSYPVTVAA